MDDGFGDDQSFWEELVTGIDNHLQECQPPVSEEHRARTADAITSLAACSLEPQHHWLHSHTEEAITLLEVAGGNPDKDGWVAALAEKVMEGVKTCPECVIAYHTCKDDLEESLPPHVAAGIMGRLQQMDEARVAKALQEAAMKPEGEVSAGAISVLFEALSYHALLDDAEVNAAMVTALLELNKFHDLQLGSGGRYPSLYRLLAHDNDHLRSLVGPVVRGLGPLEGAEDVDAVASVLAKWTHTLDHNLFDRDAVHEHGRPRWQQLRQPLWQALNTLFGLMLPAASMAVLQRFPALTSAVVAQACQGVKSSWPALRSLKSIFAAGKQQAWRWIETTPQALCEKLSAVLRQSREPGIQADAINALRALAAALPHSGAGHVRRAFLHLMLHQLPNAANVTPANRLLGQRVAWGLLTDRLEAGQEVAEDSHVFGPLLCRVLTERAAEEHPCMAACLKVSQAILTADGDAVAAANSADAPASEAMAMAHVAPALWRGLVGTPHLPVAHMLLSAAAKCAHLVAPLAGAGVPSPTGESRGFHGSGTPALQRLQEAGRWPTLAGGAAQAPNPHALSVRDAPGLLMQELRQAAVDLLAGSTLSRALFQQAGDDQKAAAVTALSQLLVGIHSQLRATAETVMLEVAVVGSRVEAFSFLFWTPGCGQALLQALAQSVLQLSHLPAPQAVVRADTQAMLCVAQEVLEAADGCEITPHQRSHFVTTLWNFLLQILEHGRQAGRINAATSSLQKVFDLLPPLWRLVLGADEAGRGPPGAGDLRRRMGFMAHALRWGGAGSQSVERHWVRAMLKMLSGLPAPIESCLPAEALQAAASAMASNSGVSDGARVLLAPLLGKIAPGNLGTPLLAALPNRARVPLPVAPRRAWRPDGVKKEAESGAGAGGEAGPIDLTLDEDDSESPDVIKRERVDSGAKASTSGHPPSEPTRLPRADRLKREGPWPEGPHEEWGYGSDTPLGNVVEEQKALLAEATRGKLGGQPSDRGGTGSIWRQRAVKAKPHNHLPGRSGKEDMEFLWAAAESAKLAQQKEAQEAVSRTVGLAGTGVPRNKASKPSKLRAAIKRAEDEDKEASRKLPRSERDSSIANARQRFTRRSPVPERAARPTVGPAAPLQEDPHLDRILQGGGPPPLGKRPLIPAAPRKTIQLAAAPGVGGGGHVSSRSAAASAPAPVKQKKLLSLEEVREVILGWDMAAVRGGPRGAPKLMRVPTRFQDFQHYTQVFRGLLLEELREQINQACETGGEPLRSKAAISADKVGVGSYPVVVEELQRRSRLYQAQFLLEGSDRGSCKAEDLVLLTKAPISTEEGAPLDPPPLHLLGIIESVESDEKRRGQQTVTAHLNLQTGSTGEDGKRLEGISKSLLKGTTWHAHRLLSWTPHHRHFRALCNAWHLPGKLLQHLLKPQPPAEASVRGDLCGVGSTLPLGLVKATRARYNASQQSAVATAALKPHQFTLIQGPPGTGKTSTVIAIVSALLTLQPTAPTPQQPPPTGLPERLAASSGRNFPPAAAHKPPPKYRVLLCAQSNAAIDELIMRLAEPGVFDAAGKHRVPNMVRLGKMESAHPNIHSYHLDTVSERHCQGDATITKTEAETDGSQQAILALRSQLKEARQKLDDAEAAAAEEGKSGQGELGALRDRRRDLSLRLNAARDKVRAGGEVLAKARREVRQAVIRGAEVVACTLSSAGGELHSLSKGAPGFNAVIIDEAAQALEPAVQIAFQLLGPEARIVMVGDSQQLPATVISKAAEAHNLTLSLFERLNQAGWPVVMLSEQYRMHPSISAWPASYFYRGTLVDGPSVRDGGCAASFHAQACFPPLAFFDCREGREKGGSGGGSLANHAEADLVCTLLSGLAEKFPEALGGSVAVLTPYKSQLSLLKSRAKAALRQDTLAQVQFATVDGFQGKEADVVIFSCVRARGLGMGTSIGFLADIRRMNVALTRARRGLWVVGRVDTLSINPAWTSLIDHARTRKCLFPALPPYTQLLHASHQQLLSGAPTGAEPSRLTGSQGGSNKKSTEGRSKAPSKPGRSAKGEAAKGGSAPRQPSAKRLLETDDGRAKKRTKPDEAAHQLDAVSKAKRAKPLRAPLTQPTSLNFKRSTVPKLDPSREANLPPEEDLPPLPPTETKAEFTPKTSWDIKVSQLPPLPTDAPPAPPPPPPLPPDLPAEDSTLPPLPPGSPPS